MKNIILLVAALQAYTVAYSQSYVSIASQKEETVQIDTIQISPQIKKMIFKYYFSSEAYDFKDTKRFGRFEICFLGDTFPFQKDTLIGVSWARYKDINGDGILDMVVTTMLAASGGRDFEDTFVYDPRTKRFKLLHSDTDN